MKIKREKLLKNLQDFALRGNGVIIGSPGVGKTYLLNELRQNLKSAGIPHLLLPVDQLGDGTDETLQRELSYEGNLIDKLKSVPVSGKKAILLFDAFDAARNEQTRKRFLRLIQHAIRDLKQWNVVVTVRTYDAKKSHELLDLFGNFDNTDLTQYHTKGILCRHFTILPLKEDEIRQAFDQIPYLESLYNGGSEDFRQLLANPFNLWLLEKILKTSKKDLDSSQIHSEVQLLGLFWQRRVEVTSDEVYRLPILTQIARQMVHDHSLTVRLDNIDEDLGLDQPARKTAWDELQSDEILVRVSSTRQRIAFSHNILFDYAISILLIDDEPRQLEDFVREDPSRPLFLRPSLTYFFTRLWYYAPENFWKAFWRVFRSSQSAHLRIARLIPTSVIVNEIREIAQLNPLLGKLQNEEGIANEAITRLLQLLRVLQIEHDPLWSIFFDRVSAYLHPDFAWDLASLTSEMLERGTQPKNMDVINTCGRIGHRLLKWSWQERENDRYERLGSYWAIPLVAKTYGTNVEESRALLKKVLALKREDHFPMYDLTQLAEHIDKIWDDDPEFVGLIYRAGITSTRHQGYSMCQHWLVQHFPDFLRAAPLAATQAAIESLNRFIIGNYTYHPESVEPADSRRTFKFRGKLVHFVEDSSHIGDEGEALDEPIEVADALFEFITELAMSQDPLLDSLLDVFRDYVWVAFFWKRLLKTAAQFPDIFAPRLFELCTAKPMQIHYETSYNLALFLEAAASKFTSDQLRQIEESILTLPEEAEDNLDFLKSRRNQLLAQIPPNLLLTDAAKTIREQMERENDVPVNQRPISFVTISPELYTDEKQLQEQGIDTTTPENQKLQRFFGALDKFNSDWQNDKPTEEATELILPTLKEGYTSITENTEANKKVIDLLWYKLTDCTAILARVADNPESHLFAFCRQVLLDGAKHELPKPDPEFDAQFNSVYSPFPRHEAAMGLLSLIFFHPDAELLDAIEKLASDPVPSVRMVTAGRLFIVSAKAPEKFWHIVENRATHETNNVVQKRLYATLTRVVVENEEKTTHVMDKLLKHTPPPTEWLDPTDPFIALLMWLRIDCENTWARKTIEDTLFNDPIRFANTLNRAVFWVIKNYVVPKNIETERAKRAIEWLSEVIDVVSDGIKELCTILKEHRIEEVEKQLHDTYKVIDEVIVRLYFAVARKRDGDEEPVEEIPDELRRRFYNEVKPLMARVIDFVQDRESGVMFAETAHYFIKLLTRFLSCNPKEVLGLAEGVARSSKQSGYNFDSLAVRDVVKFVEIVLADHRSEVRDGKGLEDLLKLLDIFIEAGWSDAIGLVWCLDEVFR